jgi:triosephosphate isomerase
MRKRKNIVAGNWKLNTTVREGLALARGLAAALTNKYPDCDVIIGVPFTHLELVVSTIRSDIQIAAQNVADQPSGAYTGEVSAGMIASTGATHVIVGHSERRAYYHETPEILKRKVKLALGAGLTPIFCIGELLSDRDAGRHFEVVDSQISESLFDLSVEDFGRLILAYEPVWAIGTGRTASADQAQEMHAHIRQTIAGKYGDEVASLTSILYGGSCNASNARELFANPDVDGGLIGGASLSIEKFVPIIEVFE